METGQCCPEKKTASRPAILLVEDDKDNRETLSELLDYLGFRVRPVADGVEAQSALLVDGRPDLILLDIYMPNLDGRGLLEWLRSRPEVASVPVVVLTSFSNELQEVESLGVSAAFLKPAVIPDLIATLSQLTSLPLPTLA